MFMALISFTTSHHTLVLLAAGLFASQLGRLFLRLPSISTLDNFKQGPSYASQLELACSWQASDSPETVTALFLLRLAHLPLRSATFPTSSFDLDFNYPQDHNLDNFFPQHNLLLLYKFAHTLRSEVRWVPTVRYPAAHL